MQEHHLNVEFACKFGILEAILINQFQFWIKLNESNDKNFHDGRYWTFNTIKALNKIIPYVSESKIRKALNNLIDRGVLITGNFNKSQYDRTLWYAFTDEAMQFLNGENVEFAVKPNANNKNEDLNIEIEENDVVVELQTNKNDVVFKITKNHVDNFIKCYPNVDITQQLLKMKAWLDCNPAKRKTKQGMLRFVNSWLSKEQDKVSYLNNSTKINREQDFYGKIDDEKLKIERY